MNFSTTVAYHICPSLPATFTQPRASTLAVLCITIYSPECVVEPSVEERVVAVGAHGEHVAEEEDEVVVVPATNAQ